MEKPSMHILMILEELNGKDFHEGGITTLVDMPLNSDPSTVSRETLELKIKAVESRIYIDVGFWGGLVPENAFNLEDLSNAGVLGLKGAIAMGNHADMVVWDPDVEFDLDDGHPVYLKHSGISA
ncbi:allantoinase isoform X2 [Prunus yedoensis var. nudiflora]|uniref:Allantoinase isoform X2 n=1 Tax=Prunus yedoensis var. nudiflora TaxID=2094558 RepID=A0A314YR34_PRUYE|nr:allantoinase isoform X2 [Prunus yedoensis var. nudiflora]